MGKLRNAALAAVPICAVSLAVACSSGGEATSAPPPSSSAPPPGAPMNPASSSSGSSAITPQTLDASPAPVDAAVKCEELGKLEGLGIEADFAGGDQWFWGPLAGRSTPTRLGIIASAASASTEGQTVQLGVGVQANYATCTHCMAIAVGCDGEDCSKATWFFAHSGTARFDQVATAPGETFSGRFDDVVLVQVTIDDAYVSTPVANGGCFRVTSATFSAMTVDVAPAPSDAGSADAVADGGVEPVDGSTDAGGQKNNGNGGGGRNGNSGALRKYDGGTYSIVDSGADTSTTQ